MARIRTAKPELWVDEIVGTWSRDARLLFIATWNFADDEGILRWSAAYLKASAFPYDDDLAVGDVEKLMAEMEDSERVFVYVAGKARQRLGYIVNFRRHQVINRPGRGRFPPPPLGTPEVLEMYGRRDGMTCHLCNETIDAGDEPGLGRNLALVYLTPRSDGGTDQPSNVRLAHLSCKNNSCKNNPPAERPRNGSAGGHGDKDTDRGTEKKERATRIPAGFKATPEMVAWARERCPHVDGRLEMEKFRNYWESKPGRDATKTDWVKTWRNWMIKAAEQTPTRRQGRPSGDDRIDRVIAAGHEAQAMLDAHRAAS